jgi:hypothetical protein
MTTFQLQEMNNQYPAYNCFPAEEEQMFEAPRAPKLRGQQAPMDYQHMSLPLSKDEFMSQVSRNHSCPSAEMNLHNNNMILQQLT